MLLRKLISLTTAVLLGLTSLANAQPTLVNEQSIANPDAEPIIHVRII